MSAAFGGLDLCSCKRGFFTLRNCANGAVTSCSMVLFSGQPGMVSSTVTETTSSSSTVSESTMPSSVIGRLISGSMTPSSACRTALSSS